MADAVQDSAIAAAQRLLAAKSAEESFEGWMRFRHPDYDGLRALLDDVGETVQLHAA